jgi:hypothetical protein
MEGKQGVDSEKNISVRRRQTILEKKKKRIVRSFAGGAGEIHFYARGSPPLRVAWQ